MNMQCRPRLALHGFRHEGRIHVVALCRLADRALEHKHLIGHGERVTVVKVNLQLRRTVLMDQGVDIQLLLIRKVVHVLDKVFKLRDGINAVTQSGDFPPT